jgi:nitroreductase
MKTSDYPIHPLILKRWSPRAMTGEPIEDSLLYSLFEAARWAPSCYNEQPWRFLYAKTGSEWFPLFVDLLVEFNRAWAPKAAVLGVMIGKKTFEKNGKFSITHQFDTGAAWENFALEGCSRGLVVHGMGGFDYDKAKKNLEIPDDYQVLAMFAVGRPAPKETLPPDLQAREAPSPRKKIEEFVMEGKFR